MRASFRGVLVASGRRTTIGLVVVPARLVVELRAVRRRPVPPFAATFPGVWLARDELVGAHPVHRVYGRAVEFRTRDGRTACFATLDVDAVLRELAAADFRVTGGPGPPRPGP